MSDPIGRLTATTLALALVVAAVAGAAVLVAATAPVAADSHTKSEAPDLSDQANFTIVLPATTDHYPGDQNQQNGSIHYFASGADAFAEIGAEEGVWVDFIIIDASWIDYSACTVDNTAAFGIDRGNNNSGYNYDDDLVQHQKRAIFRDDGITINFYDWSDFGNDPPYLAPEDAIVAAQGAGSNGGPCLTMTSERGWYQIQGFANGSVASGCTEEGNTECEPENKEMVGLQLNSNYVYVCDCQNEQEAREQLGPPPGEGNGDSATPTPTPSGGEDPTPTPTDPSAGDDQTPTPTQPPEQSTPTPTQASGGETPTQAGTEPPGGNGGTGPQTPTPGGGPGFGALAALAALLAAGLLVQRRG